MLEQALKELPNILDDAVPFAPAKRITKKSLPGGRSLPCPGPKTILRWALVSREWISPSCCGSGVSLCIPYRVLAQLERALAQWMLDMNTQADLPKCTSLILCLNPPSLGRAFYQSWNKTCIAPPMVGSLFLREKKVSLVGWAQERVFSEDDLPLALTAYTPCFRSEAGSAGKDTTV